MTQHLTIKQFKNRIDSSHSLLGMVNLPRGISRASGVIDVPGIELMQIPIKSRLYDDNRHGLYSVVLSERREENHREKILEPMEIFTDRLAGSDPRPALVLHHKNGGPLPRRCSTKELASRPKCDSGGMARNSSSLLLLHRPDSPVRPCQ